MLTPPRIAVLLLVLGAGACNNSPGAPSVSPSAPTAPSVPPPAQPQELVRGRITDTAWRQLASVQVEVLDGPHAGASTVTDGAGAFALTGVFDDSVRFRASKEGYADAVGTSLAPACATCARWIHLNLEPPRAPDAALAGNYDVTFVVSDSCRDIPDELKSRTYAASVTPSPSSRWQYVVTVMGASIIRGHAWDGITIGTSADHMTFTLGNAHGDPGLLEQVDAERYLSFDGSASLATDSTLRDSLAGAFDGFIDFCVLPPGAPSPVGTGRFLCGAGRPGASGSRVSCFAPNHRVILTRR